MDLFVQQLVDFINLLESFVLLLVPLEVLFVAFFSTRSVIKA